LMLLLSSIDHFGVRMHPGEVSGRLRAPLFSRVRRR
jgi:hypothetical protein